MHQRTFEDAAPRMPLPKHHRNDPSTSIEAAQLAKAFQHTHAQAVFDALRESPGSATDVSDRLEGRLDVLQVMKRITELYQAGAIVVHDEAGVTAAGRRCRRYRIA